MKLLSTAFIILSFLMLTVGCKKSDTIETPKPMPDLTGTWHVQYYIAANIVTGQPDDTVYAEHTETWKFKADSLFSDGWFSSWYDQTKNPATFSTSDSIETKLANAYSKNGSQILVKESYMSETIDIITLTDNELFLDEKSDPKFGFNDLYIKFDR